MTHAPTLQPGNIINGRAVHGTAAEIASLDPFTGDTNWRALSVSEAQVHEAVDAARHAARAWADTPVKRRAAIIKRFTELVQQHMGELAELISRESGKPTWDARTEVNSLITKFDATTEAYERRASEWAREVRGMTSRTRFIPHGVMAVLGPFNFPMSMANSHIMPALYAGNTVVFKPSELTPHCGTRIAELWQSAGLPAGVMNCVLGGREIGQQLVEHPDIDGVLFIGSHRAGIGILERVATHPEKIVAVEMGGNSPLVVWDYDRLDVALHIAIQSSMISAGQRCSSARRLIVNAKDTQLLPALVEALRRIRVGHYTSKPEPYYGPLIRPAAVETVIRRSRELAENGGKILLAPVASGPISSLVSPGVVDLTNVENDPDEEIFGPFIKVYRASSLDEAFGLASNTRFGLAAGIVCKDRRIYEQFFRAVPAGIVNWNQQLTGATTFAPFGGLKQSGNYRSAGYLSVDYCSYGVASFEVEKPKLPESLAPGLSL